MTATSIGADESQPAAAAIPLRTFVRDILLAFAVAVLPMLAFSALLLGLIFWYRVPTSEPISASFQSDSLATNDGSIYVNLSGTTLTTVASWSSTMAPLVLPFITTLLSFPVARRILRASRDKNEAGLPTPYQFSLMLRIITNASLGSVWHCLVYIVGWRRKRAKQSSPLVVMFCTLCAGVLLSILVFSTDTWLHFAVKTVLLTQFEPAQYTNGSFVLRPECTNVATSRSGGCTLNPAAANTFLMNAEPSLLLMANTSTTGTVKMHETANGPYAYLGIAPSANNTDLDYTTNSWAIQSTCKPATSRCVDDSRKSGPGNPYECDFAMEGFLATGPLDTLAMVYFNDSTLASNESYGAMPNPYNYAAVFAVNQNLGWNGELMADPEMAHAQHGATVFVALCQATVYDITYASVNGSVTQFSARLSNTSTTNIVMGTQRSTRVGDAYLLKRAGLDVWKSRTAQQVADGFAAAYAQIALAVAGAAFDPAPAPIAQRRSQLLVARVPVAPLASLVLANLLLVCFGIMMTMAAFVALRGDAGDVGNAQARLGIPPLVAAQFEREKGESAVKDVLDMFEERRGREGPRVAIVRNDVGGWSLRS